MLLAPAVEPSCATPLAGEPLQAAATRDSPAPATIAAAVRTNGFTLSMIAWPDNSPGSRR